MVFGIGLYYGLNNLQRISDEELYERVAMISDDVIFGDESMDRVHATPMPDGDHYISGIRVCKASEDSTEIVGLQIMTASRTTGEYTQQEP